MTRLLTRNGFEYCQCISTQLLSMENVSQMCTVLKTPSSSTERSTREFLVVHFYSGKTPLVNYTKLMFLLFQEPRLSNPPPFSGTHILQFINRPTYLCIYFNAFRLTFKNALSPFFLDPTPYDVILKLDFLFVKK